MSSPDTDTDTDIPSDDAERIARLMLVLQSIAADNDGEVVPKERHTRHFYGAKRKLTDEGYAAFRERVEAEHGVDVDDLAERGRDYLSDRGYDHLLSEGDR